MNKINNKTKNIIFSFIFLALVAGLGSLFVFLGMSWFNALTKPSQWIPNVVIPIVWTVIYSLFAVVCFLWIRKDGIPKRVVVLMIINGIFNVLWCLTFFALKLLFVGNIVIILNLILAYLLIAEILKDNKIYGYLLAIYPIWISIATTLNLALWILN